MTDHLIDIVNEKDEVIGSELKSKKFEKGFISRVVAIIVADSGGKIIVCKRGPHKTIDANMFDLSAFGNVDAGETYGQAAQRELLEETGIRSPVKMLDKFYLENIHGERKIKLFCGIFLAKSDEEPKLSHEVVSFRRMSVGELEEDMKKNPEIYCQGFIKDFNRVKNKL
ncbi:MAG: NUDIX domain-containing protein [Candidatus Staskawiczbacteria bacterium]|nr:NUDIX domain-containing protein [Candidatus Staskawiczbacteria bacterium]